MVVFGLFLFCFCTFFVLFLYIFLDLLDCFGRFGRFGLFGILGIPLEYKTDNGSPFQSGRFAEFSKRLGFKHRKITPYWPRANSGVESFMKKLGKVLKNAKISGTGKNEAVQEFLRVYRDTPHSSTQVAPNMLLRIWKKLWSSKV